MTIWQIAKHQNRFRRLISKNESSDRLSGDCLTKAVLSCQGPPDTSQSRLFPLVLHHTGELVQSSVMSRTRAIKKGFIGSFMLETALENTLALFSKTHKTTYKTLS